MFKYVTSRGIQKEYEHIVIFIHKLKEKLKIQTLQRMPFCHNLLGITSRESLVGFTNISWDSAMNLANCDPFFSLLLTSFSNFGRECSVFGLGFGDSDGIKAHIDESSSFG